MERAITDERLSTLLRRASRAATRHYRAHLAALDLTPRQAAAVLALVEQPGVTLGALAEQLRADQPTASAVVDRLLAADLVRRETDPADRRRARIHPTQKSLELATALEKARRSTESQIERVLGAESAAALRLLLGKLSEDLERCDVSLAEEEGPA